MKKNKDDIDMTPIFNPLGEDNCCPTGNLPLPAQDCAFVEIKAELELDFEKGILLKNGKRYGKIISHDESKLMVVASLISKNQFLNNKEVILFYKLKE